MDIEVRELSVELLQGLTQDQREALAWQCVGFSEQEIGDIMERTTKRVHSLLAGGKAKLRRRLAKGDVAGGSENVVIG